MSLLRDSKDNIQKGRRQAEVTDGRERGVCMTGTPDFVLVMLSHGGLPLQFCEPFSIFPAYARQYNEPLHSLSCFLYFTNMPSFINLLPYRIAMLQKTQLTPRFLFPFYKEAHNGCIIWIQFNSVIQSCLTLCDPMDCSTPGLPFHRQCPEFTQTHVHCVGDAIQPSHPLSSPSPHAFNLFQHQCLPVSQFFTSGFQSIEVSAST